MIEWSKISKDQLDVYYSFYLNIVSDFDHLYPVWIDVLAASISFQWCSFVIYVESITYAWSFLEIERSFAFQHLSTPAAAQQSRRHRRLLILAISTVYVKPIGCINVCWGNNALHCHLGKWRSMSMHPLPCQADHSSMVAPSPVTCRSRHQTWKSMYCWYIPQLNR